MLKRTHHWLNMRGISPRILPLSILLPGLFLFGCGGDSPGHEPDKPGEGDTNAASAPSDTIALASPSAAADSGVQLGAPATAPSTATPGAVAVRNNTAPGAAISDRTPTTAAATTATAKPNEAVGTGEMTPYNPAVFDGLLRANVANGKVDYGAFKSSGEFAGVLQSISTTSLDGMPANAKLAFWINAYNALVIKNVNDNPGIKQPLDVNGFFDKKKFSAAGRQVTLNQIENEIIRPTFKEPLIHFGLVCAARSCPPLITRAYTEGNVRSQLAANAEAYLADTKQNRYDAGTKTLYLSKIFEWYKDDFGGNDAGLIEFAKKHGPSSMKTALASASGVTVKFNEYDWTLNKK